MLTFSDSFAQKSDTASIHFSFSYSNALCGLMQNNHAGNTYYNRFTTFISIGIRKDFYRNQAFGEMLLSYSDKGTRMSASEGNSFLTGFSNAFRNHYLSLQFSFGFYFKKSFYLKENIGFDYLLSSDQYDLDNLQSFRGLNRFTPSIESAIGVDFKFFSRINGFMELFGGLTLFKPRYIYLGPRIGFYFKEKDIEIGKRSF